MEVAYVDFDSIQLNSRGFTNSRSHLGDIDSITKSIAETGLNCPPLVWIDSADEDESIVLIAGYRRHEALRRIRSLSEDEFGNQYPQGQSFVSQFPEGEVPVVIYTGDLDGAIAKNIEENVQDESLNPADEAEAVFKLYERKGDQTETGRVLGKSQAWVSQRVNMVTNLIPEIMGALRDGRINVTQAVRLSRVLSEDGSRDETRQMAALEALLGDEPTLPTERAPRNKTYRTKKEVDALETAVVEASNNSSIDSATESVLRGVVSWFRCHIEIEELLFGAPEGSDEVEEEVEVTAEDVSEFTETTEAQTIHA